MALYRATIVYFRIMDQAETIARLRKALQQPLPGRGAQEQMASQVRPMPGVVPGNAQPSAVLALLFPHTSAELHLLFMQRVEDGKAHGGQISFPGGRQEPFDADLRATALREANEEVGIMPADVDILGALTPMYIPVSNFQVYPFVGYSAQRPNYHLSQSEVQHVLELPVQRLFDPAYKVTATVRPSSVPNLVMQVPAYQPEEGTIIWGATAMMLSELEIVWQSL